MYRGWSPPDNANILPTIYNVLDAHVQKRTNNANGKLTCQLNATRSVLARHQHQAERFLRGEKERTTTTLHRLQEQLPAVRRIRDFDLKFFNNRTTANNNNTKGYQSHNKTGAVCHRCYIHHMPLKKKFYSPSPVQTIPGKTALCKLPPLEKNNSKRLTIPVHAHENHTQVDFTLDETLFPKGCSLKPWFGLRVDKQDSCGEARRSPIPCPTKHAFGWWMPEHKTFQFLQKDSKGKDVDVNKQFTPRLMPYEDWKHVVKAVCTSTSSFTFKKSST